MKVLITGGVRSGKSFHAESLLLAEPTVTYVAPGPPAESTRLAVVGDSTLPPRRSAGLPEGAP